MILYEYVDGKGRGIITEWRKKRQKAEQAQLDQKLEQLEKVDDPKELPNILAGTSSNKTPHIFKLRIGGKLRQRPMVCRGTADPNAEITLLYPAIERGMKLEPRDAPQRAEERRQEIIANPNRRRRYEPPE